MNEAIRELITALQRIANKTTDPHTRVDINKQLADYRRAVAVEIRRVGYTGEIKL